MIENGWLEEVKALKEHFGEAIFHKIKAIGYKELVLVLEGKSTLDFAIKIIQKKSKAYAKRQLTWFKKERDIFWFHPENFPGIEKLIKEYLGRN